MRKKKDKSADVSVALLHGPVYNKKKETVTTSITGFDLHDIARSAVTYGISRYYVVNPIEAQRKFAERILNCWSRGQSFEYNQTRAVAFELLKLMPTLDEAIEDIKHRTGKTPKIVATSAKAENGVKFKSLRSSIEKSKNPYLVLFGTGWGLTRQTMDRADIILEPIVGRSEYRHLSVRSAAAIIMDRLFGKV